MRRTRENTRHKEKPKVRLRVGDTVMVIAGKDRGQRGEITEVLPYENRLRVSGVALIWKHQRAGRRGAMQQQSGRIQLPGKVHLSNVMLVCPTCGQGTRVGIEGQGPDKQRVCRKCGAVVPAKAKEE